ncbi:MAG: Crp/Fnr family transcriptional regulator [Gammaproteobacteria bacterium]
MRDDETPYDAASLLTADNLNEWRRCCPSLQSVHIPDKGFLYRQGDTCPHVFLISQGIVKISCLTEQGDEWTVALLRQGDMAGRLVSDTADRLMEDTAQAVGEAAVFRMDSSDFKGLLAQRADLSWQIVETQCFRRQQAERKLLNILAQPVQNRVSAMLRELATLFGKRCTHGYSLEIRLTQQDLADLVGASRPVVSTIMNDLRDCGLLDYTRELICVKDDLFAYPGRQP